MVKIIDNLRKDNSVIEKNKLKFLKEAEDFDETFEQINFGRNGADHQ